MSNQQFEMVAKTFQGLEEILAEELRSLGALNVEPGRRMVSFEGDLAMLYRANMCCRTALRILKPIYKFIAQDADDLYERVKEYDWTSVLSLDKTFSIDTVSNSDEFTHSRFVTYRVKDAIVDFFKDRLGPDCRPKVRLQDADVMLNVHIAGERVTVSLDSSGESLHKRGYRVAQTEAPINEVLAAGIILQSGWHGECPLVDPMCGSGTFLVEAALIAAGIMPGIYRKRFAFEAWPDFDAELFDSIYNDDSAERTVEHKIYGADISPKAVGIAMANIKSAGVGKYIDLKVKSLAQWTETPEYGSAGVLITNPPYGERISVEDMEGLYASIGSKLKHVFQGYHAWIIGYKEEYFYKIGLTPSVKKSLLNGSLECELREYVIFDGDYRSFRADGGSIKSETKSADKKPFKRVSDREWADDARRKGFGGKGFDGKKFGGKRFTPRDKDSRDGDSDRDRRPRDSRADSPYRPVKGRFADGGKDRARFKSTDEDPNENPLARRRNERALKMLINREPSLPAQNNVLIRPRRGWKRPSASGSDAAEQKPEE